MNHALTDRDLMKDAREGNIAAAVELFSRHERSGWAVAYQMTADTHLADDILADATLAIINAFRNGNGPRKHFRAYLNTAVRHLAYQYSRNDVVEAIGSYAELDMIAAPTPDIAERLANEALAAAAFEALPANWRTLLWRVEVEGYSVAEVAATTDKTYVGTTSALHRAREGLRDSYRKQNHTCTRTAACATSGSACVYQTA